MVWFGLVLVRLAFGLCRETKSTHVCRVPLENRSSGGNGRQAFLGVPFGRYVAP